MLGKMTPKRREGIIRWITFVIAIGIYFLILKLNLDLNTKIDLILPIAFGIGTVVFLIKRDFDKKIREIEKKISIYECIKNSEKKET